MLAMEMLHRSESRIRQDTISNGELTGSISTSRPSSKARSTPPPRDGRSFRAIRNPGIENDTRSDSHVSLSAITFGRCSLISSSKSSRLFVMLAQFHCNIFKLVNVRHKWSNSSHNCVRMRKQSSQEGIDNSFQDCQPSLT